jgi:hypothetical protein
MNNPQPPENSPRTAGPTPKRLKVYTAESGYVYEYYFIEMRQRKKLFGAPDFHYLYHVTTNRKDFTVVEVVVEEKALRRWKSVNGRELAEVERYAAAKMGLFRVFDECPSPHQLGGGAVTEANIEALLKPLGLTD